MTVEVSKRTGANLIDAVDGAKKAVEVASARAGPTRVQVTFTQDKSKVIRQMLSDLQNSVVKAHVAAQPALMAIPAAERQAAHASH